jgi:hypothetical protein
VDRRTRVVMFPEIRRKSVWRRQMKGLSEVGFIAGGTPGTGRRGTAGGDVPAAYDAEARASARPDCSYLGR